MKTLILLMALVACGCTAAQVQKFDSIAHKALTDADLVVTAVAANQTTVQAGLAQLDTLAAKSPTAQALIVKAQAAISVNNLAAAHAALQSGIADTVAVVVTSSP